MIFICLYILIKRICLPWLIIILCIVICQYIWPSVLLELYLVLEIIFNSKSTSLRRNARRHKGWKHSTCSLKNKVVSVFSADVFVGHSIVLASPKHYNALQLLHWISTNNLSWAVSSGRPQLSPWPFHASKTSTPWVTLLLLRLAASMKYGLSPVQKTFPKISPQCCSSLLNHY